MNAQPAPIVAVDLPSGINGTSGAVMGAAVKAAQTVTFFRKKPGHLLLPGRLYCGAVSVADIGIPDSVLAQIAPADLREHAGALARAFSACRSRGGHKYDRGHAVVASGPFWSTGAARLAARGALRAGAGLVTIASPREALAVNAAGNLAVMVRPVDGPDELTQVSRRPPPECVRDRPGRRASARLPASSCWRRFPASAPSCSTPMPSRALPHDSKRLAEALGRRAPAKPRS